MIDLVTEGDYPLIYDIYCYYVLHSTATFDIEMPTFDSFQEKMRKNTQTAPCLVYKTGGEVYGYAYASPYKEKSGYDWTRELTIYIHTEKRGLGIGHQLYDLLIKVLRYQGYETLLAAISHPNPQSERFHQAHGFSRIATFKKIAYKFDQIQEVGWWSLDLKQDVPFTPINHNYDSIWEQIS